MKSKVAIVAILIALLVGWIVGLGCYPFVRWSPLNCRYEDIDINTGRIRHQGFLVGICVSERFEDSPVSRQLGPSSGVADWRRVNTFSPLVHYSPHHYFHGAISQTRELECIWQLAPFTPEARTRTCQEILRLWQTGEGYHAADPYIRALSELAVDRDPAAPPVAAEELPDG